MCAILEEHRAFVDKVLTLLKLTLTVALGLFVAEILAAASLLVQPASCAHGDVLKKTTIQRALRAFQ